MDSYAIRVHEMGIHYIATGVVFAKMAKLLFSHIMGQRLVEHHTVLTVTLMHQVNQSRQPFPIQ